MSIVVEKACLTHGQLAIENISIYKGNKLYCKLCESNVREKRKKTIIDNRIQNNVFRNNDIPLSMECIHHGNLRIEDIGTGRRKYKSGKLVTKKFCKICMLKYRQDNYKQENLLRFNCESIINCYKCNIQKPLSSFKESNLKKKNPQCYECALIQSRKSESKIKPFRNQLRLLRVFGISEEDYNSMLLKQNHSCAICNKPESCLDRTGKIKSLSIDHCHATDKNRSLLCQRCNTMIGMALDDPSILIAGAEYLEHHNSNNKKVTI